MPKRVVLFVCTGNVCRSPMAEHLMRDRLGKDSDWTTQSAGLSAINGLPASGAAAQVLREWGCDMGAHRSRAATREAVDGASLIVVMTAAQRDETADLFPGSEEKTFVLKSFDPSGSKGDIADPIGSSADVYRKIRDEIADALPGLQQFMARLQ